MHFLIDLEQFKIQFWIWNICLYLGHVTFLVTYSRNTSCRIASKNCKLIDLINGAQTKFVTLISQNRLKLYRSNSQNDICSKYYSLKCNTDKSSCFYAYIQDLNVEIQQDTWRMFRIPFWKFSHIFL